jgi:hypothetical protein
MVAIARNLGTGGRRHRLLMGIVFAAVAVAAGAALIAGHLPRGSRLALAIPIYLAVVGFLQYRDHT